MCIKMNERKKNADVGQWRKQRRSCNLTRSLSPSLSKDDWYRELILGPVKKKPVRPCLVDTQTKETILPHKIHIVSYMGKPIHEVNYQEVS